MTILPTRSLLTDFSSSQGQVRSGIGDLRDFLSEALGTSGITPVINSPIIKASTSAGFGTNMNSPSTTVQINGNFSITPNASPAPDPGNGSAYIHQKIQFASINASKLSLNSAAAHDIGSQDLTVYMRTNNYFAWYTAGSYSPQGLNAGGGVLTAFMSNDNFIFRGQEVYTKFKHGQLAGIGTLNEFNQPNTFVGGLTILHQPLRVGKLNVSDIFISLESHTVSPKILLYNGTQSYSIGVQPSTQYFRTAGAFTWYLGGGFAANFRDAGGGIELAHLDNNAFLYKNSRIHTDAHNGHGNNINADMVDGIHGGSIATKLSGSRPGISQVFIFNQDTPHQVFFQFDGARMRWYSNQWQTGQAFETAVNWADNSSISGSCSGTANNANYANAVGNIATCAFSNQNRHNSILNLAHALANDGIDMQMHHDAGYMRLLTTSAHPTRVNHADTASNATNASTISGGVGINSLHRAQGSARVLAMGIEWTGAYNGFAVHQYAFGSPLVADMINTGGGVAGRISFVVPSAPIGGSHRNWSIFYSTNASNVANFATTAVWDYLTASGNPELWINYDSNTGNIISVWEAEDSLGTDIIPLTIESGNIMQVKIPTINYIMPLVTNLLKDIQAPEWFNKSRKGELNMNAEAVFLHLLDEQYQNREWGLNYNPEALNSLQDLPGLIYASPHDTDNTKDWKVQLLLRQLQRVALNTPSLSMARLITDNFKLLDPSKPILNLK